MAEVATGPSCLGCGRPPQRGQLLCTPCRAEVPLSARRELEQAWRAYARRPWSNAARAEYDLAIAAAVGHIG